MGNPDYFHASSGVHVNITEDEEKEIEDLANVAALRCASLDVETGEIIGDSTALRLRADREFGEWFDSNWPLLQHAGATDKGPHFYERSDLFARTFFTTYKNEVRTLWEQKKDRDRQRQEHPGPVIRILDTRHSEGARIYDVELTDPEYLSDPVRFEVMVQSDGEAELREH